MVSEYLGHPTARKSAEVCVCANPVTLDKTRTDWTPVDMVELLQGCCFPIVYYDHDTL